MAHDPIDESERAELLRVGLCVKCALTKKVVSGKGSTFFLCTHPALPKYPKLPVRVCAGFTVLSG